MCRIALAATAGGQREKYNFLELKRYFNTRYICQSKKKVSCAGAVCGVLLASERSERDTIRGVQILAGAVHIINIPPFLVEYR